MADQDWHYLENQFDNATKESKKRMKLLAARHLTALAMAPAGIRAALVGRVTPAKTAFETKYALWRNLLAQRAGAGQLFQELLAKLSAADIEDIETAFKVVFKRGTAQHRTAFAGGRAPYQEGGDDERVDALEQLGTRVHELNPGALDGVEDLIVAVLTPLKLANEAVGHLEASAEATRTQIEPLRVALARALYQNLGALMAELGPSEEIAAYFDLGLLREKGADEEVVVPEPPILPVVPPGGP